MKATKTILILMLATMVMVLAGCNKDSTSEKQEQVRGEILERANNVEPTYKPSNFLTRQYINEYMKRMDDPNKTYYIYLFGNNGNVIGYYVARTAPVNICAFLTPPDRVEGMGDSGRVRKAPGVDGVYYGDGGCNKEYFFTADTDALIQIPLNMKSMVADQPLDVDAEPIKVSK